ncbi:hypothetical protein HMPREF0063_11669, partial [Aeromicrobium marinum DSM 15272]
ARYEAAPAAPPAPPAPAGPAPDLTAEETARQWEVEEADRIAAEADRIAKGGGGRRRRSRSSTSGVERIATEAGRTAAREIVKAIFGRRRR